MGILTYCTQSCCWRLGETLIIIAAGIDLSGGLGAWFFSRGWR